MTDLLLLLAVIGGIAYGPALILSWVLAPAPLAVLVTGCAVTATIPVSLRRLAKS